jgi:prepilin-type N-terminal cleavage/methylation domain-containing protein
MDVNMFCSENKKKNRGFTLLEMLISISLFTVVTTIAFTALFSIMDANDKAKTIKLVVNNLSTAMESMTREIRVGTNYTCDRSVSITDGLNCSTGKTGISFESESGDNIYYSYDSINKTIKRKIESSNTVNLVGEDINIDNLKFYVIGNGTESPSVQPRVLIVLKGSITRQGQKIKTVFDIQTTVSQRNPAK